jgi:hypothetical protein
MDPIDNYLSEATASRGYLYEKPTVSPREWAHTAALGIALRNAGFGLQFHAAGESFDEPAVDELGQLITPAASGGVQDTSMPPQLPSAYEVADESKADISIQEQPEEDPLQAAKKLPCPISKYKGKTLGDIVSIDPNAVVWVANKFTGDPALSAAARLICETALAVTA